MAVTSSTPSRVQASGWLRTRTSPEWVGRALSDIPEFLSDHAHLERKAASNALALIARCPHTGHPGRWTAFLSTVAREETRHMGQVLKLLHQRGGALSVHHSNPYTAELMDTMRMGKGRQELADRLLLSALIESRSCERFEALATHGTDPELVEFFTGLLRSEDGHAKGFLRLAAMCLPRAEVDERWQELLDVEADIMARQPHGPRMHAG